jgi:hypothetical protein
MFGWFARKPEKAKRLMPEGKWFLECEGDVLRAVDDKQGVKQLAKSDLTGVIIETNDTGPWGADVWWLLFGPSDQVAVAYPQGATGEDAMLTYLMSLPGFDSEKMTEAMRSTRNAVFPVWRRPH